MLLTLQQKNMKNFRLFYTTLYLAIANIFILRAQTNSFDQSFNTPYLKYGNGLGPDAEVRTILPLPNNKYLIGGWFAYYNGTEVQRIAMINEDGELDHSFNASRGFNGVVQQIARQADGKFLVAGDFTLFNNNSALRIVRLNSNGSRDFSFNASVNGIIRGLQIQPDGKILIAGWFTQVNGLNINYLARLEPNGDIDTNFHVNLTDNYINAMQLMPNGNIYIAGGFDTVSGFRRQHLARLLPNGLLDTAFNTFNGCNGDVTGMLVQPNGKILIGGWFTFYAGAFRSKLARVNTDGSLDTDFIVGDGANSDVNSFAVQADGKIIIGGFFNNYNGVNMENIARLNANGSLDNSFNIGSGFTQGVLNYVVRVSAISIRSDGKIYIGGDFIKYNGFNKSCLLRLNANGSFDGEFNPYNATDGTVNQIYRLPDRHYLIAGNFTAYNNVYKRGHMFKLLPNGLLNQNFQANFNATVKAFVVEPNGNITAIGSFSQVNGSTAGNIARINAAGIYDSSFNAYSGGFSVTPNAITTLNGKYLIGANGGTYKGRNIKALELINTDGSIDTLFGFHNNLNGSVQAFYRYDNGKILVAGSGFTAKIFRLNANGTFDNTFNSPFNFLNISVTAIAKDTGNKILAAVELAGTTRIIRLFDNGVIDSGFLSGAGTNGVISTITVQTDGKILLGGNFTIYNGIFANRIIRLNNDGSYDFLFQNGGGANNQIKHIIFEPEGKLIIGGSFNFLAGNYIGGIGRMLNDREIVMNQVSGTICAGSKLLINYNAKGSYFGSNRFIVQLSDANGNFNNALNIGEGFNTGISSILCTIPFNLPVSNQYRIRVISLSPAIVSNDNGSNLTYELCPSISITSPLKNKYCQGEPFNVSFDAIGVYNVGNIFTVQISDSTGSFSNAQNLGSFSGGNSGTIQTLIPLNIPVNNKYRIRVISTNPVVESADNGFDITINSKPEVTVTLSGNSNFCLGDSTLLSANTSGIIQSIIWLRNENPTGLRDTFSGYYAKNSGTYRAKVTSVDGCEALSNTVNITTFQNNLAQLNVNTTQSCLNGNRFVFTDLTSAPDKKGRLWQINNQSFTDSVVTRQFIAPGKYSAVLIIQYNNGCIDTVGTEIRVHPQTNVNIAINKTSQCLNDNQFEFYDSSSIQSGIYTRLWQLAPNEFYTTPIVQKKYGTIGSFQIQLKTTTDFGCVDSGLAVVNINPNPKAKFGYRAVVPCFDNNLFIFSDSSTIQNGSIDYVVWQFPGYPPSYAPNPGISFFTQGANKVQMVAVSKLGCTDTAVQTVDVLPNPPKPYIAYVNGRLETNPALYYKWYINGIEITDSNSRFFTPRVAGSYTVRIFNSDNCSSLSDPFIITNVSANQFYANDTRLSLYPNPADNHFTIIYPEPATVTIFDLQGKAVFTFEHHSEKSEVDVSSLPKGVYMLTIKTKEKRILERVVIQ